MPVEFASESFSVKFSLDEKDLRRLVLALVLRRPGQITRLTVFTLIVMIGFMIAGPALFHATEGPVPYLLSAIAGLAFAMFVFYRSIQSQISLVRKMGGLGPRTVIIGPEGIYQEIVGIGESIRPWSVIQKTVIDAHAIDLYINEFQVLSIPRHAFATPWEFDDFVAKLRSYHPF